MWLGLRMHVNTNWILTAFPNFLHLQLYFPFQNLFTTYHYHSQKTNTVFQFWDTVWYVKVLCGHMPYFCRPSHMHIFYQIHIIIKQDLQKKSCTPCKKTSYVHFKFGYSGTYVKDKYTNFPLCLWFISWHASNYKLVENLLASMLHIHSFSACYTAL